MTRFFSVILAFLIRCVMLVVGLAVVAGVITVAAVAIALWLVRRAWATLTGRPVAPLVVRVNPRAQWNRVYRGPGGFAPRDEAPAVPEAPRGRIPDAGEVIDVEAKPPKSTP